MSVGRAQLLAQTLRQDAQDGPTAQLCGHHLVQDLPGLGRSVDNPGGQSKNRATVRDRLDQD